MISANNMRETVENIKEALAELKEKPELDDMEKGMMIAYVEALSIIQSACNEEDHEKIGIDFDVDARYL